MKEILYNYDNLKEEDINRLVRRAKMLIINSDYEILLATSARNYQIIGGHLDEGESYDECVVREIKEETGIDIPFEERKPFFIIKYMCKDYPNIGINSKYIANYYSIKCDIKPDLSKVQLTQEEKDGNFELRYIHKDKILEELENSLKTCTRKEVVKDTIEVVKEYLKNN